jgi:hypothetical protein
MGNTVTAIINGVLGSLGGSSWQAVQMQQAMAQATRNTSPTRRVQQASQNQRAFSALLGQVTLPAAPAANATATELATYNQQLLAYINQMMALQTMTTQRLGNQLAQLATAVQRQQASASSSQPTTPTTGNAAATGQRGVSDYRSNSLLLDNVDL